MSGNREELDRALEQMAQETPEMPADFHARWTEAVRLEAAQQKRTEKKQEGRRQWRYILSAAAVFVFLIGGTLLTRNLDKTDRVNGKVNQTAPVLEEKAADNAAAPAEAEAGAMAAQPTSAPTPMPEAYAMNSSVSYEAMPAGEAETDAATEEAAWEADMAMEEAAWEADMAMEEAAEAPMADAAAAGAVPEQRAETKAAMKAEGNSAENGMPKSEEIFEETAGMAMGAAAVTAAEEPAEEEAAKTEEAADAETEGESPEEAAEAVREEPAGEAAEESAEENGFVSFLKDLGIFTLKTAAVAAGAAALAFLAACIHKAWKKRKQ